MTGHILDQIVEYKRNDLPRLQQDYALDGRRRQRRRRSCEELLDALQHQHIIAEIKRASPSMGPIHMDVDYLEQAQNYQAGGAAMISVLTDERYFAGSFRLLEEIGRKVDCPLLCKDFIIDEWQLDAADLAGADAVLLIVSCFGENSAGGGLERLRHLYNYSLSKGLLPLVEIYSSEERYDAYALKPLLLGVNSRNLKSMEIDLAQGAQTLALMRRELSMPQSKAVRAQAGLPDMPLLAGESGISGIEDARAWAQAGANCLLVGTSLMLATKHSGQNGLQAKQNSTALGRDEVLRKRIAEFQNVFMGS